jgi:hypothetical protein
MQDDLTRAQHYRSLALQMRDTAESETHQTRRRELLDLASQYEHLAEKLVGKHVSREAPAAGDFRQPK